MKPEKNYSLDESDFNALEQLFQETESRFRAEWIAIRGRIRHKHIGELCGQFEAAVHRISTRDEKKIRFKLSGEELKLDLDPIRPLFKTLIHLVSNACDHGIEMPYERLASGKKEDGHVFMRFYYKDHELESGFSMMVLVLTGNNSCKKLVKRALQSAWMMNLLILNQPIRFCLGRFSTANSVTQTSGRGSGCVR